MRAVAIILAAATFGRPIPVNNVSDPCADWLINTFGGQNEAFGWCSALARDTLHQFFHSGGLIAPYRKLDTCSCGASALFALWLFSGVPASWKPTTGLPVLNYTLELYQWANMFSSQTHRTWPAGCAAPTAASHAATMAQLLCALGLPPCTVVDEPMPRAVQVWLDSRLLEDDHTFVIQRASADEWYLWQGFVGQYGLWDWIQQEQPQTPLRNFSGGRAAYAGRLNSSGVLAFLARLDELTAGRQPWRAVQPLWQELFWVAPPAPESQGSRCNATSDDPIRIGLGFWTQDYVPAQCVENAASVSIAWDKAHDAWRAGLCTSPAGQVKTQCISPLNPTPALDDA